MPSTLPVRRITEEELEMYARLANSGSASGVDLPSFGQNSAKQAERPFGRQAAAVASTGKARKSAPKNQSHIHVTRPYLVPDAVPSRQSRRVPLLIRANRALRTVLVAFCGIAILGYGLDVAASNDVGRMQEQARRLNEQNCEKSAQLLQAISFKGIRDSVTGKSGLVVPEHVIIAHEVKPPQVPAFKPNRHHLPVMAGY
jgi:hypothetical protein